MLWRVIEDCMELYPQQGGVTSQLTAVFRWQIISLHRTL